jgi:O-antigen biosynthesis rhamnosyltransferase
MKLLNITKRFEENIYGGIENLIDNLSNSLPKENIKSEVYTLKKKKIKKKTYKIFSDKIFIDFFSCPVSFDALFNFKKIVKDYGIFNFHFPWPFMDILSLFVPKNKVIITYHSDITKKNILYYLYFPLMVLFLFRSRYIVVTSYKYLNSSWLLSIFKTKVRVIPIGIDPILLDKKKKYKINLNIIKKKYFIFVGNLRDYKGLDVLIRAFKTTHYNLLILGSGKLERYVKKNILNCKNIHHIKITNEFEKANLIKNSLSLILPSTDRREAYGIVLLEALSLKKPLITTNLNTGTSFINLHNKTGFVCEPNSESDIVKYCKKIYDNSSLRNQMGRNSYQRYLKYFTKKAMIKKYLNLFNNF